MVCAGDKRPNGDEEGVRQTASGDEVDGPRAPISMVDSGQSGRLVNAVSTLYDWIYNTWCTHSFGGLGGIGQSCEARWRADNCLVYQVLLR